MKSNTSPIDRYKTEDLRQLLYTIPIGHLFLGLLLLSPDISTWTINYSAQICLTTAVLLIVIALFYHWQYSWLNWLLVLLYFGLFLGEYLVGFPGAALDYDTENYQISKGVFLDLFLWILPGVYIGLRFCLGIPLILIAQWNN